MEPFPLFELRACRLVGLSRDSFRHPPQETAVDCTGSMMALSTAVPAHGDCVLPTSLHPLLRIAECRIGGLAGIGATLIAAFIARAIGKRDRPSQNQSSGSNSMNIQAGRNNDLGSKK